MDYKYICAVVDTDEGYKIHTPGDVAIDRMLPHAKDNGAYSDNSHFLVAIGDDGLSRLPGVSDTYPMQRFRDAIQERVNTFRKDAFLSDILKYFAVDARFVILNHNICGRKQNPMMLVPE